MSKDTKLNKKMLKSVIMAQKAIGEFLPNENVIGEPFWCIMEQVNDEVTGSYYAKEINKEVVIPIFSSEYSVNRFYKLLPEDIKNNYVIRGISKKHNKLMEKMFEDSNIKVYYAEFNDNNEIEGYVINLKELNDITLVEQLNTKLKSTSLNYNGKSYK